MNLRALFSNDETRHETLITTYITSQAQRCVQCGICSYNCPQGIDVRRYAWQGKPVRDSHCLSCGECVARCPRGVLRFERTHLFRDGD